MLFADYIYGFGQQVFDGLARGDVDQAIIGLAAEFFQFGHAGLARVVGHVGDNHPGPGLGQSCAKRPAQHTGPAYDHRRLAAKPKKLFKILGRHFILLLDFYFSI